MGKKILIVNVNWVGDVVFSTPFIRAVREAYPESSIACLIHPRCAEVLKGSPRIDEIIVYDEDRRHRGLIGKWCLVSSLRKRRFDTAFILHRSFTKALLAFLAGARERIGYPTKNRLALLTRAVEEPAGEIHKVEYFLNIARAVGIPVRDVSYEFFVADSDRASMRDILAEEGVSAADLLIVMCPGGNWGPKRWPSENFAALADALIERSGARIAISGAASDRGLAEKIKGMMSHQPILMCGRTSLKTLGALFERARLVIANDTGPMHLAVAMKAKVLALFGPTSPAVTGPYGSGDYRVISKNDTCDIPCYDLSCNDNRCMAMITVEEVLKTASEMLVKSQSESS